MNACFRASAYDHAILSEIHTEAQVQQSSLQRFRKIAEIHHKIDFTADFVSAAAEIERIVKLKINFTVDFGTTAAEIEQIVKLIEIIKKII